MRATQNSALSVLALVSASLLACTRSQPTTTIVSKGQLDCQRETLGLKATAKPANVARLWRCVEEIRSRDVIQIVHHRPPDFVLGSGERKLTVDLFVQPLCGHCAEFVTDHGRWLFDGEPAKGIQLEVFVTPFEAAEPFTPREKAEAAIAATWRQVIANARDVDVRSRILDWYTGVEDVERRSALEDGRDEAFADVFDVDLAELGQEPWPDRAREIVVAANEYIPSPMLLVNGHWWRCEGGYDRDVRPTKELVRALFGVDGELCREEDD